MGQAEAARLVDRPGYPAGALARGEHTGGVFSMALDSSFSKRVLGSSSSIRVCAIGLGCRSFGRQGLSQENCRAVVEKALDLGINFFDTADVYGNGRSEEFLGEALDGKSRQSYVLATKGGMERLPTGGERQNGRPEYLRHALENSLRRLKVDCVDLYQLHGPDPAVPLDVTAEAFTRFCEEGKTKLIGVSNMNPDQLEEWLSYIPETVSVQLPYSLADTKRADSLFSADGRSRLKSVSLIPWAPLFMGMLINPPPLQARTRTALESAFSDSFIAGLHGLSRMLEQFSRKYNTPPAAIALAFVLTNPRVAVIPVGSTNPEHLAANLKSLDVRLEPDDLDELKSAAALMPPPEVPTVFTVAEVLDKGHVAVLPVGVKVRVPQPVAAGDKLEIDLWDGTVKGIRPKTV